MGAPLASSTCPYNTSSSPPAVTGWKKDDRIACSSVWTGCSLTVGTGVRDDSASSVDDGPATVAGTSVARTAVAGTVVPCGDDTVPFTFESQAVIRISATVREIKNWENFIKYTPKVQAVKQTYRKYIGGSLRPNFSILILSFSTSNSGSPVS